MRAAGRTAGTVSPGVGSVFLMAGQGTPWVLASVDWASFVDASLPSVLLMSTRAPFSAGTFLWTCVLGCLKRNFVIVALTYLSQTSEGFCEQHLFHIPFTLCFKAHLLLANSSSCMLSAISPSVSPIINEERGPRVSGAEPMPWHLATYSSGRLLSPCQEFFQWDREHSRVLNLSCDV